MDAFHGRLWPADAAPGLAGVAGHTEPRSPPSSPFGLQPFMHAPANGDGRAGYVHLQPPASEHAPFGDPSTSWAHSRANRCVDAVEAAVVAAARAACDAARAELVDMLESLATLRKARAVAQLVPPAVAAASAASPLRGGDPAAAADNARVAALVALIGPSRVTTGAAEARLQSAAGCSSPAPVDPLLAACMAAIEADGSLAASVEAHLCDTITAAVVRDTTAACEAGMRSAHALVMGTIAGADPSLLLLTAGRSPTAAAARAAGGGSASAAMDQGSSGISAYIAAAAAAPATTMHQVAGFAGTAQAFPDPPVPVEASVVALRLQPQLLPPAAAAGSGGGGGGGDFFEVAGASGAAPLADCGEATAALHDATTAAAAAAMAPRTPTSTRNGTKQVAFAPMPTAGPPLAHSVSPPAVDAAAAATAHAAGAADGIPAPLHAVSAASPPLLAASAPPLGHVPLMPLPLASSLSATAASGASARKTPPLHGSGGTSRVTSAPGALVAASDPPVAVASASGASPPRDGFSKALAARCRELAKVLGPAIIGKGLLSSKTDAVVAAVGPPSTAPTVPGGGAWARAAPSVGGSAATSDTGAAAGFDAAFPALQAPAAGAGTGVGKSPPRDASAAAAPSAAPPAAGAGSAFQTLVARFLDDDVCAAWLWLWFLMDMNGEWWSRGCGHAGGRARNLHGGVTTALCACWSLLLCRINP